MYEKNMKQLNDGKQFNNGYINKIASHSLGGDRKIHMDKNDGRLYLALIIQCDDSINTRNGHDCHIASHLNLSASILVSLILGAYIYTYLAHYLQWSHVDVSLQ